MRCGAISAIGDWFRNNCQVGGGVIFSCRFGGTYYQQQRSSNFTAAELAAFSASAVQADLTQGNALMQSFGGSATVTLLSGTTPVASTSVPLHIQNGIVTVTNPSALESWVQTHGVNANGFDVDFDDLNFYIQAGPNTVYSLVRYGSDVAASDSYTRWGDPNDPGCCYQVQ